MGGGYQELHSNPVSTPGDAIDDDWGCLRADGRNLTDEWLAEKLAEGKKATFVRWKSELDQVDFTETDYIMGERSEM